MVGRLARAAAAARALAMVAAAAIFFMVSPLHFAAAGEVVFFDAAGDAPGTIVIRTSERRLYLVLEGGLAVRYVVGVGRAGRQWTGASSIEGKHLRPHWAPPAEIKRSNPNVPDIILSGASNNPMGEAALTLSGGEYAIHGTNRPESIGRFVSYGCIRMYNEDILDLFDRVEIGTPVVVRP